MKTSMKSPMIICFFTVLSGFVSLLEVVFAVREIPYITLNSIQDGEEIYDIVLSVPLINVPEPDTYFCYVKHLEEIEEGYVLKSLIVSDHKFVHHVAIGLCAEPAAFVGHEPWACKDNRVDVCKDGAVSFGAWDGYSKTNEYLTFPKDVSVKIGSSTIYKYVTFDVHFAGKVIDPSISLVNVTFTFTRKPTKYGFQTYMMMADGAIPANKDKGYFAEIACPWHKPEVFAFAAFVHTHHHGYMGQVFRIRNGTWTLLGSQLSQDRLTNMVPVPTGHVNIQRGDIMAAHCLFINKGDTPISFGQLDSHEMCNLDVLFAYEFKYEEKFRRTGACLTQLPAFRFCSHEETSGICGGKYE